MSDPFYILAAERANKETQLEQGMWVDVAERSCQPPDKVNGNLKCFAVPLTGALNYNNKKKVNLDRAGGNPQYWALRRYVLQSEFANKRAAGQRAPLL